MQEQNFVKFFLFLNFLGYPHPKYQWLRNGEPLQPEFTSEPYYKILNTKRSDAGRYQCVAKNDVGSIFSEEIQVTVACMYRNLFFLKNQKIIIFIMYRYGNI